MIALFDAYPVAEAFIISNPADIFYLTGFYCEDSLLLAGKQTILFTDSRYTVASEVASCEVRIVSDYLGGIITLAQAERITSIGIQEGFLTVAQYKLLLDNGFAPIFIGSFLQAIRRKKTDEELKKIQAAQAITDRAFNALLGYIKPGVTEKQLKARLEYLLYQFGADGLAFETIVASGANGAKPHAVPSNKAVQKGEFITFDFGARLDNYDSDMTRTVCIGEPTNEMLKIYNSVLKAHIESASALRDGIACNKVDGIARSVFAAEGLEQYFTHSLGHGVGIEIHEQPNLSSRNDSPLEIGNVVTVEPGLYIKDFCGVRIENMYVINRGGSESLTASDKNLIKI